MIKVTSIAIEQGPEHHRVQFSVRSLHASLLSVEYTKGLEKEMFLKWRDTQCNILLY